MAFAVWHIKIVIFFKVKSKTRLELSGELPKTSCSSENDVQKWVSKIKTTRPPPS